MFSFLLCRVARQVLWGGMHWRVALDDFCVRQTEVIKAFLNERSVIKGKGVCGRRIGGAEDMYL